MTCHNCRIECKGHGKDRHGFRRFICTQCQKTFTEPHESRSIDGMYLLKDRIVMALQLLVEGNSVRSIERTLECFGHPISRKTILKLSVHIGQHCEELMSRLIRNVRVKDVQCGEIWSFVQKKEKNRWPHEAKVQTIGDAYCFVALERETKLVLAWHLGKRSRIATEDFISKLRTATAESEFQITTDGFQPYITAIDSGLSDRVNFAQLIKVYRSPREGEQRYSPAEVVDAVPSVILGNPNPEKICTSHIERQNLTMRMQMRRLTRLTNAFSKKWENLNAALALYFAHYNFCRVHQALRVTPAMAAGITDHVWEIDELLAV